MKKIQTQVEMLNDKAIRQHIQCQRKILNEDDEKPSRSISKEDVQKKHMFKIKGKNKIIKVFSLIKTWTR